MAWAAMKREKANAETRNGGGTSQQFDSIGRDMAETGGDATIPFKSRRTQLIGTENPVALKVLQLIKKDAPHPQRNVNSLNELHASGEWTDLEMVVNSGLGADGERCEFTALAWAAASKQLEVMRWLI